MSVLLQISVLLILLPILFLIVDFLISQIFPKPWKINVSKTKLIREIIDFTGPILHENGIKHYPEFVISYYSHKNFAGVQFGNTLRIYVKNNKQVSHLVNTVLHEVAHYIQMKTDSHQYKMYNKYTLNFGYWKNPLEIEARKFATKWEDECIRHLEKKNMIEVK